MFAVGFGIDDSSVCVYVDVYGLVILCPDAGNLGLLLLDRVRLENNHKTNIHILHTIHTARRVLCFPYNKTYLRFPPQKMITRSYFDHSRTRAISI